MVPDEVDSHLLPYRLRIDDHAIHVENDRLDHLPRPVSRRRLDVCLVIPRSAGGVYDAETVALWIFEDDIVCVGRAFVPVDLAGAEGLQPLDLAHLVLRVEVEMDTWRQLDAGWDTIERDVGPGSVSGTEQCEIVIVALTRNVVECPGPKRLLAFQVVHPDDY
jgi:hypothetical protein